MVSPSPRRARACFFSARRRARVFFCGAGRRRRRGARRRRCGARVTARRVSAARTGGGRNSRPEPRQAPASASQALRVYGQCANVPARPARRAQTRKRRCACESNYLAAQKAARRPTRRSAAFHALEDVTPRLLVCFWTWLATSIYEASSLGICCWSQRLKRGGRKRTHVFLPTAPRLIAALRPRTQRRGSQPTLNTECCTHYYLAARRRAPHT